MHWASHAPPPSSVKPRPFLPSLPRPPLDRPSVSSTPSSPLSAVWPQVVTAACPSPSITLHLKISCPSSPAVPMGHGMACPVPQVKIEMESDYDSDLDHHRHRDMSSETTL